MIIFCPFHSALVKKHVGLLFFTKFNDTIKVR